MATATSLTATRIQELTDGWESVAQSQAEINAAIGLLNGDLQIQKADLEEFNNITLPPLQQSLAANDIAVSDITDTLIPNLQTDINSTAAAINDINSVYIPALQTELDSANGKNTVTYSELPPTNEWNTEGDTWFQRDALTGTIVAQFRGLGEDDLDPGFGLWESQQIDGLVIANIDAGKITVGTMSGERLEFESIRAEHFVSDVILSKGRIASVGPAGQSVELNPTGFYVYGPTDEGRPAYVSFPTEGGENGKPNIISGTLQATTMSVDGNPTTGQAATFRMNSQLEPGATLTLNNSIIAPVSEPSVEVVANDAFDQANIDVQGVLMGHTYVAAEDSIYFIVYNQNTQGFVNTVCKFDLVTDSVTVVMGIKYGARTDLAASGITYLGGQFYVGYQDPRNPTTSYIARYDLTTVPGLWFQNAGIEIGLTGTSSGSESFTLGNDGTSIWVADQGSTTTTNAMRFRRYTAALSTVVQETVNTTFVPTQLEMMGQNLYSLNVGNFDFGSRKFIVTYGWYSFATGSLRGPKYEVALFGTTGGAREYANEFDLMRSAEGVGLIWRGSSNNDASGAFVGLSRGGLRMVVSRYTNIRLSAKTAYWYIGSSFYRPDTDGGGPITEGETVLSPMATLKMYSRWRWKATVPKPQSGMESRIYINVSSDDPASARLQATLSEHITSKTSSTIDLASAFAKTVSTFGSTIPSVIQSQETISQAVTITTVASNAEITGTGLASYMLGRPISGSGIPAGTTIISVIPGFSAVMSQAATASATVTATLTLPRLEIRGNGYARISELERVVISSTTDASTAAGNEPALRVGNILGNHLRIDGNEILSMVSDTATGNLFLNNGAQTNVFNLNVTGEVVGTTTFRNAASADTIHARNPATTTFATNVRWASANNQYSVVTSSARKYKDEIVEADMSSYLEGMKSLKAKTYVYHEWYHPGRETQWGLIADEVEAAGLIPWVVYEPNDAGEMEIEDVNYGRLVVPLIAGWQDHEARIAELETLIRKGR